MARITTDETPKTLRTKSEIDPNNWALKYRGVEGKSAIALNMTQKLDNKVGVLQDIRIYAEARDSRDWEKIELEFLLIALGHNLRKIVAWTASLGKAVLKRQNNTL